MKSFDLHTSFFVHCFHLGNAVALVTHVLIDTTHVRVAIVAFNDDAVAHSHTHTTSLHVRVVGDQDAIHILIRVRHRSRFSPRVSLCLCVSDKNAEFLQITLGLVLRLVELVTISGLLCFLHHPNNFGFEMVFDETWKSSMMFSSTLTVVQSSGPSDDSLGLASSRTLVRDFALCLLHSEAPLLGLLHVLLPLDPRGLAPSTRNRVTLFHTAQIPAGTVVACSTGFHQTSSINTVRLVMACIHHNVLNFASASTCPL